MTKPLAEGILALDFRAADAARADELNATANEGMLKDEQVELEAYRGLARVLANRTLAGYCGGLDRRTRLQKRNLICGRRAHPTRPSRDIFSTLTGPKNGVRSAGSFLD